MADDRDDGNGHGPAPDPGDRFVSLVRCPTTAVADFVRSLLDQAGIESVLQDQYLIQVFGFLTGPIGGVRVQVRMRDVPAAIEILRHPPQGPLAETDLAAQAAAAPVLRCPRCGSSSVSFEPAEPAGFLIPWIERILPLPFLHGRWKCGECGRRWLEVAGPRP
ncbi:MAG TPA: DUF2007 domain-containing protein [Candidatus Eisenbacteria bacterium]